MFRHHRAAVAAGLALALAWAPASSAAVTIRVYIRAGAEQLDVYQALKEKFEQANPDIRVELENVSNYNQYFEKFQTMLAGGVAPDVLFPSTFWAIILARQGALLPLDDFIRKERFDLNQYYPEVLNLYRYDGKLYGLPNDMASLAFYYNMDLFDQAGLPYPRDAWTFDEFLAAGKKLTADRNGDGKPDQFGASAVSFSYTNPWIWSSTGTAMFDDPVNPKRFLLNTPAAYEALQFLQDARWVYNVFPQPNQAADFVQGTAAMHMSGHFYMPAVLKDASFRWNLAPLPRKRIPVNRADGSSWSIAATTKHPEAAWRFVKFAAGYEGQMVSVKNQWLTPALKRALQSEQWLKLPGNPHVNKLAFLAGYPNLFDFFELRHPLRPNFFSLIDGAIRKVLNREAGPREAIEAIVPQVEALLKQVAAEAQ